MGARQRTEHVLAALRVAPCGSQPDSAEHPSCQWKNLFAGQNAKQARQGDGERRRRLHADQRINDAGEDAGEQ